METIPGNAIAKAWLAKMDRIAPVSDATPEKNIEGQKRKQEWEHKLITYDITNFNWSVIDSIEKDELDGTGTDIMGKHYLVGAAFMLNMMDIHTENGWEIVHIISHEWQPKTRKEPFPSLALSVLYKAPKRESE